MYYAPIRFSPQAPCSADFQLNKFWGKIEHPDSLFQIFLRRLRIEKPLATLPRRPKGWDRFDTVTINPVARTTGYLTRAFLAGISLDNIHTMPGIFR